MTRIDLTDASGDARWTLTADGHAPVTAPADATAEDLVRLAAERGLATGDDLAVFVDDGDEPLTGPITSGDGAPASLVVARRGRIEVTVHHDGRFVGQHVSAAARVGRVRRRAAAEFDLEGDEADLHVLQFTDTDLRPDERERIGDLDRNGDGELSFDLVRVRPATVTVTINDRPVEVRPGRRSVAGLKRAGGVAQADVLEQVVDGRLVELADGDHVDVEGGEVFVSHPRDSASS